MDVARHAALNPFGKIPILVVGQHHIIESAAIQEYLEDMYPLPSLRGPDPLTTANIRAFIRAVDLYLFTSIFALRSLEPGSADFPPVLEALSRTLDRLEALFGKHGYVSGEYLTLADCALAPACFYLDRFLARQGHPSPRASRPVLQTWWNTLSRHDSVTRVLAQLESATNARR
jgi:glutathione S-transferase